MCKATARREAPPLFLTLLRSACAAFGATEHVLLHVSGYWVLYIVVMCRVLAALAQAAASRRRLLRAGASVGHGKTAAGSWGALGSRRWCVRPAIRPASRRRECDHPAGLRLKIECMQRVALEWVGLGRWR